MDFWRLLKYNGSVTSEITRLELALEEMFMRRRISIARKGKKGTRVYCGSDS